jgi:hypothetical protein
MGLTTMPITGDTLVLTPQVPPQCVNLAYLSYPSVTPDTCVVVMNSGESLAGNRDDPQRGTRQIRIMGLAVRPSGQWVPLIRPGSFWWEESVATYRLGDAYDTVDTAGLPATSTLLWEYSAAVPHMSAQEPPATTTWWSDPQVAITGESPRFDGVTCRVAQPPVAADPAPALTAWNEATAIATPSVTLTDALRGTIRPTQALPQGATLTMAYTGTQTAYAFDGHWDTTGVHHVLDLNPLPGHYCLTDYTDLPAIITSTSAAVQTHGAAAISERTGAVITTSFTPTARLAALGGIVLYVQPVRCWVRAADGVVTATPLWQATLPWDDRFFWHTGESHVVLDAHQLPLARCYLRLPTASAQIELTDTRTPGGGLRAAVRLQDVPEAERSAYFDLASVDGDISMEHGAVVVRVPQATLDRFGELYVRAAIAQSLAAGIAYVLEVV